MSNPVADASPVQKQAVRRVPLEFDQNGDPQFSSVTSPDSFKVHALGVMPPKHVIPVIFVPGIMGTNLCANGAAQKQGTPAWIPPNGAMAGLGEWWRRKGQTPVERQEQLSSANTEVYSDGKVGLPRTLFTLTESEAKRRGWGEVHFDSYAGILAELELALNDQKLNPGTGDPRDLPVWTVAKTLKDAKGHDVLKEWGPIKGDVPPLTDSEFNRLADYYFPVWACGYNWLGSNEDSADVLVQRISDAISWYKRGKYWISVDQVIVVTHSMGGLVARRAAQKVADQILGVVHGVQPVGGAPVVYRRFRAGTETGGIFDLMGSILAAIIGWDAADITCVMANSAGPLELLPTKYYPPGWLKFQQERDGKNIPLMPYLPVVTPDDKISDPKDGITDPYRQIYSQRVQDVWWGMVDDTLLDPAGVASKTKSTAMDAYSDTLLKARTFHDNVKLYFHPNTYAYYGSDLKQVAFSEVRWVTRNDVPADATGQLPSLLPETFTKLGQATVAVDSQKVTFSLANRDKPKDNNDPSSGDGTVPSPSGDLVTGGPNPGPGNLTVFRMRGFDHQHSYGNLIVQGNVLYCIAKITQKAPLLS